MEATSQEKYSQTEEANPFKVMDYEPAKDITSFYNQVYPSVSYKGETVSCSQTTANLRDMLIKAQLQVQ